MGLELERIAIGHDQVRKLARLDRANKIGDAEHLCSIQRHSFQRFFMRQPVSNGRSRILRKRGFLVMSSRRGDQFLGKHFVLKIPLRLRHTLRAPEIAPIIFVGAKCQNVSSRGRQAEI